ncbi:glutathionylspermidine synthase family protein [Kitasatospora sp. NA04385]|uniref:glutathionylspermidine synthase family protein n=1 Tax=Kitasatospora sp. NA04385 TaxID=2742135 RepID=UPI0015910D99|nr:glutathionylspermidine synthase family protein [Kitasatospora sp. NA04385]QKW23632.1 glutathionylspermidine synthase family protein [Kitasatospora sp. NA04385]
MDSQGDRLRLSSEAPGAPGDIWNLLPQDFRKSVTDLSAERSRQIHDGIAGSKGDWRPLRPMVLDRGHYDELGRVSARLMHLVLEACRRRAGNAGELQDALGVPAEQTPLLDRSAPLEDGLLVAARPDVLYADGVPQFVEFNIDGALGGTLQADLLAERFRDLHRLAPGGERIHAPASAVDARFAAIRRSLALPEGARVAIPVFRQGAAPGLEDAAAFLGWLGPMCDSGRRHGMDTVACTMDQLTTGAADDLLLDGRRVDAVFRLFLAHDQPAGPGLDALVRAVRAGRVAVHTPETTWLLSDKTTMAWLWEDLPQLPEADRQLIARHLPWTALLPAGTEDEQADGVLREALARRTELVLKPVGGYGGSGVVLGPEVTDGQWRQALLHARREGRHVLQRHVLPDLLALDFADQRTGAVEHAEVPFVLGPFMFDGAPSGVLVRHGVPGGGPVLNAHHGAVMSTVLLADRC